MPQLTTDNGTVGYTDHGDGPPVVFVHGFLFDKSMWKPQIEHFANEGYRVLCVDLLGFAESTAAAGSTPLEAHTAALLAVLDARGVATATVVGYSMGGQVALDFTGTHPARVNALVLCDTFAHLDTAAVMAARHALADRLEREGTSTYAEEFLPQVLCSRSVREQPDVAEHARAMMTSANPAGAAAALRGRAQRRDYTSVAATLTIPVLVLAGSDDCFDRGVLAAELAGTIAGSRLEIIAAAGHTPSMEQPESFNRVLQSFLEAEVNVRASST